MKKSKSRYHGHRFPDVEELHIEQGVIVSYETIRRRRDKSGKGLGHRVNPAWRKPCSTCPLPGRFGNTVAAPPYLFAPLSD
ncbi:hypothetical protein BZM27_48930 [Paraburkholderia steynii]|uniref:Uncharacterized protein n=1 Tax=Paraburkholderia steynii TaxID=1245441 RepID=A0A4R0X957_9BURK|nr:hypothetical protein BZM27_48930 [Paraburkholderia steynii]